MTHLTLEIIAKTLFDVELSEQTARLGEAVRVVSEAYVREAGNPLGLPDWLPLPGKRRKRRAINMLHDMIEDIIRRRRGSREDHGDLLSMLLLAVDEEGDGSGMSDQQARDEAITLFNAGHDSTAAALAWIWYLVAKHPAVETRLVEEVDTVLAGRAAGYGDVPRLPYTEMVVKEALRLYPPTWSMFPREAVASVEIGGYTIPKRSWVYIFPWVTHRDPRFFENPAKFEPERFAPGRSDKIPQYAYFPFGGGPRVCIGNTFATMEMILILASVLQEFRVKLAADQPEAEPEVMIAIRPKGGMRVLLHRRAEPAYAGTS
jgi:cytochrome P450